MFSFNLHLKYKIQRRIKIIIASVAGLCCLVVPYLIFIYLKKPLYGEFPFWSTKANQGFKTPQSEVEILLGICKTKHSFMPE